MAMPTAPPLYPKLDELDENYRLLEISKIRHLLEEDAEKHDRTRRRHKAVFKAMHYANIVLAAVSGSTGAVTVYMLASGFNAPLALPSAIISIIASALTFITGAIQRLVMRKIEKHDRIRTCAETKLSSVKILVSKALEDGKISSTEFAQVMKEYDDFREQKNAVRSRSRKDAIVKYDQLKKDARKQVLLEMQQFVPKA